MYALVRMGRERNKDMKKVYVCSPLSGYGYSTMYTNIENAKKYCKFIAELGALPIAPHIYCTEFLDDNVPDERELGRNIGLELMMECKEVWVFGDHISDGMAREIELANEKQMPVKFFTGNCTRRNFENETKKDENQIG